MSCKICPSKYDDYKFQCYVGSLLILLQTKEINYKTDLRLQSHQFKRKPQSLNLQRFAEVWPEKVFNLAQ